MAENLSKKIEAILFAVGKRVSMDDLVKLSGVKDKDIIKKSLAELKDAYEKTDSSIRLIEDSEFWKMSLKEEYGTIMQNIVTETELSKSVMETLAVIAWKHPTLQAEVIRIRTNKAYDDMKDLEELGFITRSKFGRTRKINLTEKFFNYFDLPEHKQQKQVLHQLAPEGVKEKVADVEEEINLGEKAIEEHKLKKEQEKIKQEQLKKMSDSQKEIHLAVEAAKQPENQ